MVDRMSDIRIREKECMCCESTEIHENLLQIVQDNMIGEEELYDLAELFKVFGDSTRILVMAARRSLRRMRSMFSPPITPIKPNVRLLRSIIIHSFQNVQS